MLVLSQQILPRYGRIANWVRLALCFTAPGLFLALVNSVQPVSNRADMGSQRDYQRSGSLMISFRGLQIPLADEIRIGGSDADDYLIARIPGSVLVIGTDGQIHPRTVESPDETYSATLGKLNELPQHELLRTFQLPRDSKLCFGTPGKTVCGRGTEPWWAVEAEHQLIVSQSVNGTADTYRACQLSQHVPAFRMKAALGQVPTADKEVFPLDIYGRPECAGASIEASYGIPSRHTFLHFDRNGHLFVSQLPGHGAGQQLIVENGATSGPSTVGTLAEGVVHRLTVFRLQSGSPLELVETAWSGIFEYSRAETERARLIEVAGLDMQLLPPSSAGSRLVQIGPKRPLVVEVPSSLTCKQVSTINLLGAREHTRNVLAEAASEDATVRVPFLASLGQIGSIGTAIDVRRQAAQVSVLDAHGCRSYTRSSVSILGAMGHVGNVRGAEIVALGSPGNGQLRMSVAEFGVPSLAILLLLSGVAFIRAVVRRLTATNYVHIGLIVSVLAAMDVALVIRLSIALQEIPAQPELSSVVFEALAGLVLVPLLIEGVVYGASVLNARWRKGLRVGYLWAYDKSHLRANPASSHTARLTKRIADKFAVFRFSRAPWLFKLIVGVCLAAPVVHLGLVATGFREQLGGIRITTLIIPAYLILFALLIGWLRANQASRAVWMLPIVGCLISVSFLWAHDNGALIMLVGPILAMGLLASAQARTSCADMAWQWKLTSFGIFLLAGVFGAASILAYGSKQYLLDVLRLHPAKEWLLAFVFVVGWIAWRRWHTRFNALLGYSAVLATFWLIALSTAYFPNKSADCSVGDVRTVADCLDRQSLSTNQIRLSYQISPALSRTNLTGEARGMNAVFDELGWLTREFKGQGFLGTPPRKGLDKHDNAIASHVIGPHGRFVVTLVGFIFALPAILLFLSPRLRRRGLRQPLPWLTAFLFAFTSAYMILANLLLVPFTGRNVYLTNPFSLSDLFEGSLVLLLVLLPLATARRHEVAQ